MFPALLILFLAYLLLVSYYTYQWNRVPGFIARDTKQKRGVSVLIPARNEENNIGGLLVALQGQQYPSELIEVIVIDDGSNDNTTSIVQQFSFATLLQPGDTNGAAGKKQALKAGIEKASNEWIITIDADSIPGPEWISTINDFIDRQGEIVCVVGPVTLTTIDSNLLQAFQRYDHLMFQGITAAAIGSGLHALGNGANLCYRKDAFHSVGGFEGIDQLASGDDILLVEKFMQQYPGQVQFLKSNKAIVKTTACANWKELWQQRVRWVSKAGSYKNSRLHLAQWITGGFNAVLLIQSAWCVLNPEELKPTISIWILKAIIEWMLIAPVAKLYREPKNGLVFFMLQPIHACYLIAVGLWGMRKTYRWKERTVH